MLKTDLILRNPLRLISSHSEDVLSDGGFGAVLARAGVGKTAFLVQVSLNFLLGGKNVLHISLNDPIQKVNLWYREVFNHLARQYNVEQVQELWESLLPHRFIMTFKVEGFSIPRLEERVTDLTEQQIFMPQMVIIDGLPFNASIRDSLLLLKSLAQERSLRIWFTIKTHRHEAPGPDGLPAQLKNIADLFELAIQLKPKGEEIYIIALKGEKLAAADHALLLDPATMLIKKQGAVSVTS